MSKWFKKRSRIERLQERYAELMKKSFKIALKNQEESEKVQQQAYKVFDEIKYLTLQKADK